MNLNISIKSGPALSDRLLKRFEYEFHCNFPADYREFLLQYNGGYVESAKITGPHENLASIRLFFGLGHPVDWDLRINLEASRNRIPAGFIPVAEDACGNWFLININSAAKDYGVVYFWDHEFEADEDEGETPCYDNLTKISDSFQMLLDCMVPDPIEQSKEGDGEITFISPDLFRIMDAKDIKGMKIESYQFLSEDDLRELGPEIVRNMNPEFLKTLSPILLKELTSN